MKVCKEMWNFLKESRYYMLFMGILFFASALFGFLFPVFFQDIIARIIGEVSMKTQGMGFVQLFFFILENNATTSFIGMILGLLIGIVPVFLALFNGYVLGFVMNKTAAVAGNSSLLLLLPHGIFEITAVIISLGLGLKLGLLIFKKKKKGKFLHEFENSFKTFLFVVLPLLILAALIEAWLIVLLK